MAARENERARKPCPESFRFLGLRPEARLGVPV